MIEKKAVTQVPIDDVLARRWSGRAYDPARPVGEAELLACLEAARWSPSCYGAQPWRYVVCERERDAAAWRAAMDCLVAGNRAWAQHAPVLLLAAAAERFAHNGEPNRWAQYDAGAAGMSLCLQAAAEGLMAHQMGGFDAQQARQAFAVPEEHTPMAMIALGYPLPPADAPTELQERESAPRERAPLEAHFFYGAWGRGAPPPR